MSATRTQSCDVVPWLRHGLRRGKVVFQQPDPLSWARTNCAHAVCLPCPCPCPVGWDCSHPPAQSPCQAGSWKLHCKLWTDNSGQAHPSYFSSPATVVDVFISVTHGCFRTSLLLLATRASPQLSFLGDALNALFPGQPVKCLLFTAMPKIPVNIYEPICHVFFYDGKKVFSF